MLLEKAKVPRSVLSDVIRDRELCRVSAQALTSLGMRFVEIAFSVVATIVLARILGVDQFGAYSYALAWLLVLTSFSLVGCERLLVRHISKSVATGRGDEVRGVIQWSSRLTLRVSLVVSATGVAVWFVWNASGWQRLPQCLLIAFVLMPLLVALRVATTSCRGFQRIVSAQVLLNLVRPGVALLLFMAVYVGFSRAASASAAMLCLGCGTALALGGAIIVCRRAAGQKLLTEQGTYCLGEWRSSIGPLMALTVLYAIDEQIDLLVVGGLFDHAQAGIFSVAKRAALITQMPMLAASFALAPVIAKLTAQGDLAALKTLFAKISIGISLITVILAAGTVMFGRFIVLIFGHQYTDSYLPMSVLSISFLLASGFGPVAALTIMSGFERSAAKTLAISSATKAVLLVTLGSVAGLVGIAIASAIGLCVWNVLLIRIARDKFGLPFPVWRAN